MWPTSSYSTTRDCCREPDIIFSTCRLEPFCRDLLWALTCTLPLTTCLQHSSSESFSACHVHRIRSFAACCPPGPCLQSCFGTRLAWRVKELGCFWARQTTGTTCFRLGHWGWPGYCQCWAIVHVLGSLIGASQEKLCIALCGLQFSFCVSTAMFPSLGNGL